MLPCPESKKHIFGNIRALCFPPQQIAQKGSPAVPVHYEADGGLFGLSDKQRGDVIDDAGEEQRAADIECRDPGRPFSGVFQTVSDEKRIRDTRRTHIRSPSF